MCADILDSTRPHWRERESSGPKIRCRRLQYILCTQLAQRPRNTQDLPAIVDHAAGHGVRCTQLHGRYVVVVYCVLCTLRHVSPCRSGCKPTVDAFSHNNHRLYRQSSTYSLLLYVRTHDTAKYGSGQRSSPCPAASPQIGRAHV